MAEVTKNPRRPRAEKAAKVAEQIPQSTQAEEAPPEKPTSQEKQIKFHVSLRKRDTDLAAEYEKYEKGDWSARARELMYKGLMAERNGNDGNVAAANAPSPMTSEVAVAAEVIEVPESESVEERLAAELIANLDDNF